MRKFFRSALIFFALFCLVLDAGAQTPSPSPSPTPPPDKNITEALDSLMTMLWEDKPKTDALLKALEKIVSDIVDKMPEHSAKFREPLLREAQGVASVFLSVVIVAEVMFMGLRLMLGSAKILDQLTRLTVISIIYGLLAFGIPSKGFPAFRDAMTLAGREVANEIVKKADIKGADGKLITGKSPPEYWIAWIGSPNDPNFKFSRTFILARIVQANDLPSSALADISAAVEFLSAAIFWQTIYAQISGAAGAAVGSYSSVIFNMFICLASYLTFDLVLCLGLSVMPLMFFESFYKQKIWASYLSTLVGLALIPALYFILSAVGFVFTTWLFDMCFPGGAVKTDPIGVGKVLACLYLGIMRLGFEAFASVLVAAVAKVASSLVSMFLLISLYTFGVGVVGAFVGFGGSFALLAPLLALKWNQGFVATEALQNLNQGMTGLGSGMVSGIGSSVGEAIGKARSTLLPK